MKCIVKNCGGNDKNSAAMFRFPKDKAKFDKWCQLLNLNQEEVKANSKICTLHFNHEDYNVTQFQTRLRSLALPKPQIDTCNKHLNTNPSIAALSEESTSHTANMNFDYVLKSNKFGTAEEIENFKTEDSSHASATLKDQYSTINLSFRNRSQASTSRMSFSSSNSDFKHVIQQKNRLIKNLKRKLKRKSSKFEDLQDLLSILRKKSLITHHVSDVLERAGVEIPSALFKRMSMGKKVKNLEFSSDLKKFAVTLHYYSPKAYNYVRETFQNSLPHPSTIRKYYSSVDCEPGFIKEAFENIKTKADQMNLSENQF